jgi:hypothetical protein
VVTDPSSDDCGGSLSFFRGFGWVLVDERHLSRLVLVIVLRGFSKSVLMGVVGSV